MVVKYACCDCRKAFSLMWTQEGTCPDCGKQMLETGSAFKSPPKKNRTAWEIVRLLLEAGIRYYPGSIHGQYRRPGKLRDVSAWIIWYKRGPYNFPGKHERLRRRVEGE
jgi:hypothetical protein